MSRKFLTLIALVALNFTFLSAAQNLDKNSVKNEDFQLLADDVKQENGIVTATKNVVVYSQTYLVTADKAVYDQNASIIELFGNVNMMKGAGEASRSNYAKINLKSDESSFEALFMMNKDMEVWMRSDESSSDAEYYRTRARSFLAVTSKIPTGRLRQARRCLIGKANFCICLIPSFG